MKSLKRILAVAAFAAPVVAGGAYATSLGETEDQWTIESEGGEYTLDRAQTGGEVTLVVVGPDGELLDAGDYPVDIAEAAEEFGAADWEPDDGPMEVLDVVDGMPCYHEDLLAAEGTGFGLTVSGDEGTFAIEVDEDGQIDKAYFDRAVPDEELFAVREANGSYLDLDGAQELKPCAG